MKIKKKYQRLYNMSLEKKEKIGLDLLKQVIEEKRSDLPLIINFSGGKDSLICLSMAMKVYDNVECCYADGGFELPETLPYIKKRCKEFGVKLHVAKAGEVTISHRIPGPLAGCQTLKDFILNYEYWPVAGNRWCSIWLKQRVMKAYWRQFYDNKTILYKVVGVRMFESPVRLWKYGDPKHYKRLGVNGNKYIKYDREHHPCRLVYPILDFTDKNVEDYLKKENIEVHTGYKVFGVSGCKYCPVHTVDVYEKILSVYPNIYDDIIELEEKIGKPAAENKYFIKDIKERVLSKKENKNNEE